MYFQILNSENPENAVSPANEEPENLSFPEVPVTKAKKRQAAAPERLNKPSKKRKSASREEVEKSDSIEGEETHKVRKGKKSKKKVVHEEDEDASVDGDDGEPNEKGRSSAEESDDDKPERKKVSKVMLDEE